jgi:hypothetical protein
MPCLYLIVSENRGRDVLKLGFSKYATPAARVATLSGFKGNHFHAPMTWREFAVFPMDSIRHAYIAEHFLKAWMKASFPVAPRFSEPCPAFLPRYEAPESVASGEWLVMTKAESRALSTMVFSAALEADDKTPARYAWEREMGFV